MRENGGQYTHAALWVVRAMAELGRRDRAAALLDLLNPINCTPRTPEEVARYQVEPYVVAADVYGAAPHVGRGGWTWYTGSSGWMLRVALESVLGLRIEDGDTLVARALHPRRLAGVHASTGGCPASDTVYEIAVGNPRRLAGSAWRRPRCDGAPGRLRRRRRGRLPLRARRRDAPGRRSPSAATGGATP